MLISAVYAKNFTDVVWDYASQAARVQHAVAKGCRGVCTDQIT